jgi:hypothetical protein
MPSQYFHGFFFEDPVDVFDASVVNFAPFSATPLLYFA